MSISLTDLLDRHIDDYAERNPLTLNQQEVIDKARKCKTPALGYTILCCTECGEWIPITHPCHTRFCPSCGQMATNKWLYDICQMLPHCPYDHNTFTVPLFLRPFFVVNKRLMINLLFESSSYAQLKWARKHKKFIPGLTGVCQTAGSDLHQNPHLHYIGTSGGLSLDHKSWIEVSTYSAKGLSSIYTARLLKLLRKTYLEKKIVIPPEYSFITSYKEFDNFLREEVKKVADLRASNKPSSRSWFIKDLPIAFNSDNKDWCVHVTKKPKGKIASSIPLSYISRYIKSPPISNARIISDKRGKVKFKIKNHITDQKEMFELPTDEFISRLIFHIPEKNFPMVRRYGIFSNRAKAKLLPIALEHLEAFEKRYARLPNPKKIAETKPSWRSCYRKLTGEDPALCRSCGKKMKVLGHIPPHKSPPLKQLSKLSLTELCQKFFDTS